MRGILSKLVLTAITLGLVACGSSGTSNPSDASSCPNIGGTWKITSHCQPGFVGNSVPTTQTGCQVVNNDQYKFSGTVNSDGTFTLSDIVDGQQMTCNGKFDGTRITESCVFAGSTETCEVQLDRP